MFSRVLWGVLAKDWTWGVVVGTSRLELVRQKHKWQAVLACEVEVGAVCETEPLSRGPDTDSRQSEWLGAANPYIWYQPVTGKNKSDSILDLFLLLLCFVDLCLSCWFCIFCKIMLPIAWNIQDSLFSRIWSLKVHSYRDKKFKTE